jgi:hypothetical protein
VGSAVPLGEIETLEILFLSFDEIGKLFVFGKKNVLLLCLYFYFLIIYFLFFLMFPLLYHQKLYYKFIPFFSFHLVHVLNSLLFCVTIVKRKIRLIKEKIEEKLRVVLITVRLHLSEKLERYLINSFYRSFYSDFVVINLCLRK